MTEQALQADCEPVLSIYGLLPTNTSSQYSHDDRIRAITAFLTLGNYQKTSESVNIPRVTIQDWSKKEWWQEAIIMIRQEKAEEMDIQLSKIVETGFQQAHDRLLEGNHAYTKEGEYLGRQEMSGRDIGTLTGIMYDKLRIHRNQPTSISASSGTDAKLAVLAEKMMEISKKQQEKDITPE